MTAAERDEFRCACCASISQLNMTNYGPKRETLCDECGIYWKKYGLMRVVDEETLQRNSWVDDEGAFISVGGPLEAMLSSRASAVPAKKRKKKVAKKEEVRTRI